MLVKASTKLVYQRLAKLLWWSQNKSKVILARIQVIGQPRKAVATAVLVARPRVPCQRADGRCQMEAVRHALLPCMQLSG